MKTLAEIGMFMREASRRQRWHMGIRSTLLAPGETERIHCVYSGPGRFYPLSLSIHDPNSSFMITEIRFGDTVLTFSEMPASDFARIGGIDLDWGQSVPKFSLVVRNDAEIKTRKSAVLDWIARHIGEGQYWIAPWVKNEKLRLTLRWFWLPAYVRRYLRRAGVYARVFGPQTLTGHMRANVIEE